jgi:hypothetical protein
MKLIQACIFLVLTFLLGSCTKEIDDEYLIKIQVGGSDADAIIYWENDREIILLENEALPWTKEFRADKGEHYYLRADINMNEDNLWIRVLQDGDEINVSNGCICGGASLQAEASGYFGEDQYE